jgi:hypothetical protein
VGLAEGGVTWLNWGRWNGSLARGQEQGIDIGIFALADEFKNFLLTNIPGEVEGPYRVIGVLAAFFYDLLLATVADTEKQSTKYTQNSYQENEAELKHTEGDLTLEVKREEEGEGHSGNFRGWKGVFVRLSQSVTREERTVRGL